MSNNRRKYSREFKIKLMREIEIGTSIASLSRQYNIHPTQIQSWKRTFKKYGDRAFQGNGKVYTDEARIAELERTIGQLTIENSFLKKVLEKLETQASQVTKKGGESL